MCCKRRHLNFSFFLNLVPCLNFLDFIFVVTSEQGINGQLGLLKKSRRFNQLLLNRAMAGNPRVPASAGLSPVGACFHSSTAVSSRISLTKFATATGCFSGDCNHCGTVVQSVHMKCFSMFSETGRSISCCNGDANKAACNSNFGIARNFMGAIFALPERKTNSVVSVPWVTILTRRKATALKTSCAALSPNKCNSSPSLVSWK